MAKTPNYPDKGGISIKIKLDKSDFDGELVAFVFDAAGTLLEKAPIKAGKVSLSVMKQTLMRSRLFIAPIEEQKSRTEKPTLKSMSRLGAYSPVLLKNGSLINTVRIPEGISERWFLCSCSVRGRVVKADNGLPVCGAKVHICEVDKFWRWIFELPELEVFRLRDELLKMVETPELRLPQGPWPDPSPIELNKPITSGINFAAINPQPKPPGIPTSAFADSLPADMKVKLVSPSAHIIRDTLINHLDLIRPYLCLWPYWWTFRCDEITVVETDSSGQFEALIKYLCGGDKPDLYFWVEYEIGGVMETVYHPPIPCHTYWDYACNSEVTIEITDDRVPSCDNEPNPAGCKVQVISIGRKVSLSELHGNGATVANEGLTTAGQPFGGKLEPRVWFSRTDLLAKGIEYYRWSYRRLTEGDGAVLTTPGPWTHMTRTVVRHYAKQSGSDVTHEPFTLGPFGVGTEANLFKLKPATLPPGGIEWTVMDEREDLASAHFETHKLGTGTDACAKAFVAAGKYELKLELFKSGGVLVNNWDAEGIDLEMTNIPAPFGTSTVTATNAPNYNRINPATGTEAFRMVLHVDNNCCSADIDALSGAGLTTTPCGFYEITPTANVTLGFTAGHPNGFATFSFSVKQGVSTPISLASVGGRVGNTPILTNDSPSTHAYVLAGTNHYDEIFTAAELLGSCTRAAFSEALHVWTMAQDGYGFITSLNRFNHGAFALTPPS